MGTTSSKKTDNTGEIVNNLTIEDKVTVENKEIVWLLIIIVAILILKTIFKIYMNHRRGLRKRYLSSPARVAVIDSSTV